MNDILSTDEALCSHIVSTNKHIRFKHIMFLLTGAASAHPSHVSQLIIGTMLNVTPPPLAEATPPRHTIGASIQMCVCVCVLFNKRSQLFVNILFVCFLSYF